jgi:hypothetical protein
MLNLKPLCRKEMSSLRAANKLIAQSKVIRNMKKIPARNKTRKWNVV